MTDWITAIHWSELGPRYFSVYYILIFQCFISAASWAAKSFSQIFCPIWRIETVKVYERSLFKFPYEAKKEKENGANWLESTTQRKMC